MLIYQSATGNIVDSETGDVVEDAAVSRDSDYHTSNRVGR